MAEYSRLMSGQVVSNGSTGQTLVICPCTPNFIEVNNRTLSLAAAGGVLRSWWYTDAGQGSAYLSTSTSGSPNTDTQTFVAANGFTTIQAAQALQYGPVQTIGASGSITGTNHTTITVVTTANHNLVTGNWVILQNLYATTTTGMQQIAGIPFMVTVINATEFTVFWDADESNYTTITGSVSSLEASASFRQVLYPVLYAPGVSFVAAINTSTYVVTTTAPHNFVVGQQIGFRIPSIYGTTQLNELPNIITPGSPTYFYVSAVGSSTTFTIGASTLGSLPPLTAFTTANVPFIYFTGLKFPQVFAVGDVNTGGYPYTGAQLYPSPTIFNGSSSNAVRTTNGPAIYGSYINGTYSGFIIGSAIAGTATNILDWRAYTHDLNT